MSLRFHFLCHKLSSVLHTQSGKPYRADQTCSPCPPLHVYSFYTHTGQLLQPGGSCLTPPKQCDRKSMEEASCDVIDRSCPGSPWHVYAESLAVGWVCMCERSECDLKPQGSQTDTRPCLSMSDEELVEALWSLHINPD